MKRGLYILAISLGLSTGMLANQNTNNEDINETNAIQSEEQVLELDEYNADYLGISDLEKAFSKMTGAMAGFATKIIDKLSKAVDNLAAEICPGKKDQFLTGLANKGQDILGQLKMDKGDNPTQAEIEQFIRDNKKEIQDKFCP